MAHTGCYVPAAHATVRAIDKLFTRIAVDESVEENKSTFMAEMKETSYIIENLTPRSLVIIDELGRGRLFMVVEKGHSDDILGGSRLVCPSFFATSSL
jgi:dsDNA-specific endonuclease/ATPase MutS2